MTLRLAHILDGVAVLPDRVCDELIATGMDSSGLRLMLAHAGYDLLPAEVTQAVTVVRAGPRLRLAGVSWPMSTSPASCSRSPGSEERSCSARPAPCSMTPWSSTVSTTNIATTRRYSPAKPRQDVAAAHQPPAGPLTLRERVLRAVRRVGLLDADGAAALPSDQLPDLVYGPQSGTGGHAALEPVVTALLAEGVLTQEEANSEGGLLRWPATATGQPMTVLVWRPPATPSIPRTPARANPEPTDDLTRYVTEYGVAPFLRRLRPGDRASDDARAAYRALLARFGRVGELPPGHTLVREHTRSR